MRTKRSPNSSSSDFSDSSIRSSPRAWCTTTYFSSAYRVARPRSGSGAGCRGCAHRCVRRWPGGDAVLAAGGEGCARAPARRRALGTHRLRPGNRDGLRRTRTAHARRRRCRTPPTGAVRTRRGGRGPSPSMPGMAMSSSTRSGRGSAQACSAASPSAASATTSVPALLGDSARSRSRASSSSSAITTLMQPQSSSRRIPCAPASAVRPDSSPRPRQGHPRLARTRTQAGGRCCGKARPLPPEPPCLLFRRAGLDTVMPAGPHPCAGSRRRARRRAGRRCHAQHCAVHQRLQQPAAASATATAAVRRVPRHLQPRTEPATRLDRG